MENNLDKYFKDNLHDRKFEMKEGTGSERKNCSKPTSAGVSAGLFWWFGGGGRAGAGGAWLVALGKNGGAQGAENPVGIAAQNQAVGREATPVFDEKNSTKQSGQSNENGQDEGAATPFPEGKNNQSETVASLNPSTPQPLNPSNSTNPCAAPNSQPATAVVNFAEGATRNRAVRTTACTRFLDPAARLCDEQF
ncbi:MAG: hypothetical protein IPM82_28655 [Saprospiraceae bacterium]|nr:hypothetical protein [Saprospiraceae bacterium]